jgi:hypothetical protein
VLVDELVQFGLLSGGKGVLVAFLGGETWFEVDSVIEFGVGRKGVEFGSEEDIRVRPISRGDVDVKVFFDCCESVMIA